MVISPDHVYQMHPYFMGHQIYMIMDLWQDITADKEILDTKVTQFSTFGLPTYSWLLWKQLWTKREICCKKSGLKCVNFKPEWKTGDIIENKDTFVT